MKMVQTQHTNLHLMETLVIVDKNGHVEKSSEVYLFCVIFHQLLLDRFTLIVKNGKQKLLVHVEDVIFQAYLVFSLVRKNFPC